MFSDKRFAGMLRFVYSIDILKLIYYITVVSRDLLLINSLKKFLIFNFDQRIGYLNRFQLLFGVYTIYHGQTRSILFLRMLSILKILFLIYQNGNANKNKSMIHSVSII